MITAATKIKLASRIPAWVRSLEEEEAEAHVLKKTEMPPFIQSPSFPEKLWLLAKLISCVGTGPVN